MKALWSEGCEMAETCFEGFEARCKRSCRGSIQEQSDKLRAWLYQVEM
jgi:hypothetical protein